MMTAKTLLKNQKQKQKEKSNMKMRPRTVNEITYTSKSGETTERKIIPMVIPSNIRALDVTGKTEEEISSLVEWSERYDKYREEHLKTVHSFENFVELESGQAPDVKWRSFNPNTTVIKE